MEISGPAQLGARATPALPDQAIQPVTERRVAPQSDVSDARSDTRDHSDQERHAAASRDISALRRAVARGTEPVGPPPSFEVSLLEIEGDLQQKLARMEAERALARDGDLMPGAAAPPPPETEALPADPVAGPGA